MDTKIQNNLLNNYYSKNTINESSLNKLNIAENKTNENSKDINISDTITINEKSENIINAKKAKDAYNETVAAFEGRWFPCGSGKQDITGVLDMIRIINDVSVDLENSDPFTKLINDLTDGATKLAKTHPELVPPDVFEFLNLYKENLMKYNCK